MIKITLDYDNGLTFPDSKLLDSLQDLLEKGEDFSVGSDFGCTALRVLFIRGTVREFVLLDTDGEPYALKDDGCLDRWPKADRYCEYLRELMKFQISERRADKCL